ncbi:MAG: hydrolase [Bdellovibrionales bacterium]
MKHGMWALLLFFCLYPKALKNGVRPYWLIWNVGQGQWVSWVGTTSCYHFDMGGEKNPLSLVRRECGEKKNLLHLSHPDWDHISFVSPGLRRLNSLCLVSSSVSMLKRSPASSNKNNRKKSKFLTQLPACLSHTPVQQFVPAFEPTSSSNDQSVIYLWKQFLLPGDASVRKEKIWSEQIELSKIQWLLLGHHGSRTSSSAKLLKQLPALRMSFASARHSKYGHPHEDVLLRLKEKGVPVLKTEEWGNIKIDSL